MEPFSIACTTCRARLKVRDPAAIGQILACPKCGSMVLIEAPVGMTLPKFTTSPGASPGAPRIQVSDSDSLADTVSGSFDDLVLVVAKGQASHLQGALDDATRAKVREVVTKDLVKTPNAKIWDRMIEAGLLPPRPTMPMAR